jgi:HNH endonuclease
MSQPRPQLEPLSEARYRLQLNVTAAVREKLELARALLSHSVPNGDLAVLLERALDELIEKAQRQRFAQTKSDQRAVSSAEAGGSSGESVASDGIGDQKGRAVPKRGRLRREHVRNSTRREIIARDGLRCSFVSDGGCRCSARSFLQIHHEHPWAKGGDATSTNLRLLCAAHNRLLAERDFGREHVAARHDERRAIARQGRSTADSS